MCVNFRNVVVYEDIKIYRSNVRIQMTCLGGSFFTKSWCVVVVLEYVDVEPRPKIYGG